MTRRSGMADQPGGSSPEQELTADELAAKIEKLAKAGSFQKAEAMRAFLMEKHPMALSRIVAAAEVIEEQKGVQLDQDHIAMWESLYAPLSQEEKNCVFYTSKAATVAPGKLLFVQGKKNSRLFLIDSGRVTLFHTKNSDRQLIGQLSRGDIVGEESFFEITHSTFSAGCQTEVKLRYFDKSALKVWDEQFPGLVQKLSDYCRTHCRSGEILQAADLEKRQHPRLPLQGRITAHILAADKSRSGSYFKGSLHDISRSGMNFGIRCSRSETAQALLGRNVDIELEQQGDGAWGQGRIVRVSFHLHNDYSVHVHLSRLLTEEEVARLVS